MNLNLRGATLRAGARALALTLLLVAAEAGCWGAGAGRILCLRAEGYLLPVTAPEASESGRMVSPHPLLRLRFQAGGPATVRRELRIELWRLRAAVACDRNGGVALWGAVAGGPHGGGAGFEVGLSCRHGRGESLLVAKRVDRVEP